MRVGLEAWFPARWMFVRGAATDSCSCSATMTVMHDLYPSKEAVDEAIASGSTSGTGETFEQLEEVLVSVVASAAS